MVVFNRETSKAVGVVSFSAQRLQRLAAMEEHHFWFRGRWLLVQRFLHLVRGASSGPVVDVGCGTEFSAALVASQGFSAVALDPMLEGLQLAAHRQPKLRLVQGSALSLPLRPRSLQGLLLLDVLEHVPAEHVLGEAWRVLKPGGFLIFSVPALPWLWSNRDEGAGHRCRYTRREVKRLLWQTGFVVKQMRYYLFLLLPVLLASRLLARRWPAWEELEERPGYLANALGSLVVRLEVGLGRWLPWPLGSSLVGLALKPGEGCRG